MHSRTAFQAAKTSGLFQICDERCLSVAVLGHMLRYTVLNSREVRLEPCRHRCQCSRRSKGQGHGKLRICVSGNVQYTVRTAPGEPRSPLPFHKKELVADRHAAATWRAAQSA